MPTTPQPVLHTCSLCEARKLAPYFHGDILSIVEHRAVYLFALERKRESQQFDLTPRLDLALQITFCLILPAIPFVFLFILLLLS